MALVGYNASKCKLNPTTLGSSGSAIVFFMCCGISLQSCWPVRDRRQTQSSLYMLLEVRVHVQICAYRYHNCRMVEWNLCVLTGSWIILFAKFCVVSFHGYTYQYKYKLCRRGSNRRFNFCGQMRIHKNNTCDQHQRESYMVNTTVCLPHHDINAKSWYNFQTMVQHVKTNGRLCRAIFIIGCTWFCQHISWRCFNRLVICTCTLMPCRWAQRVGQPTCLASAPGAQGVGLMREKKRAPGIYCMRMRVYTVLFTV